MSITKTTGDLILLMSEININHLYPQKNDVTELNINRVNKDVNDYKNVFNKNIDNNVTIHKRRPTPFISWISVRHILGVSKQSKTLIPGYTKYTEAVQFGQ